MKCRMETLVIGAILFITSCRIPRDCVLMSIAATPPAKHVVHIPTEWDNRYLAIGNHFELGGDSVHRHAIPHDHEAQSEAANPSINPLGLSYSVISAAHTHHVYSYLQSGFYTGFAKYDLRTAELQALLTTRGFNRIPENIILLYSGNDLPKGWMWCDGNNNTPDLRGNYIRLRVNHPMNPTYGTNTHVHTTNHSHKWGVDAPDMSSNINKALAKDTWTYESDTIALSVYNHIHGVQEDPHTDTLTQADEVVPLSVSFHFIQSTSTARKIPKGALVPYIGEERPLAWKHWKVLDEKQGSLVTGSSARHPLLQWFGQRLHSHQYIHHHIVHLTAFPRATLSVSSNEAPAVARSTHTHTVEVSLTAQTTPSASFPPYIRFTLLQKK